MNIGELVNLSNKLDKLRYGISFAVHHTSPVCYGRERIRSSYGRRSARSPRCPGSPFLDMLWVNPFSVSVLTYAACWCCQPMSSTAWAASPRATPAWQPPTRPCASTTRVFGHLPDDQRSSGVCWAGACALPNVSAAPFTLFAMANGLVFAGGSDRLERGSDGHVRTSARRGWLSWDWSGAAVGHLRARVHIPETRGMYIKLLGRAVRVLPPRGLSRGNPCLTRLCPCWPH